MNINLDIRSWYHPDACSVDPEFDDIQQQEADAADIVRRCGTFVAGPIFEHRFTNDRDILLYAARRQRQEEQEIAAKRREQEWAEIARAARATKTAATPEEAVGAQPPPRWRPPTDRLVEIVLPGSFQFECSARDDTAIRSAWKSRADHVVCLIPNRELPVDCVPPVASLLDEGARFLLNADDAGRFTGLVLTVKRRRYELWRLWRGLAMLDTIIFEFEEKEKRVLTCYCRQISDLPA
jgi:hypothetical protein